MSRQQSAIQQRIEDSSGEEIKDLRPLSTGNNTILYLIDTLSGERIVAKVAKVNTAHLDIEGWMLTYIANHSTLPVPRVFKADKDLLLMEYIPCGGKIGTNAQHHAAELLAAFHSVKSDKYGLERDTVIGPLIQPNTQSENWIEFFTEHRLFYMANKCLCEKIIDINLVNKIEDLALKLPGLIGVPASPSLVHGDIWSGNVLSMNDRITGFIDPAIYYADPEMDLAFSTLFGTFKQSFFKRYHEILPIRDGFFGLRQDIYNLYPLLVHARLFGSSYTQQIKSIVDRFV